MTNCENKCKQTAHTDSCIYWGLDDKEAVSSYSRSWPVYFIRNRKVVGSTPMGGSIIFNNLEEKNNDTATEKRAVSLFLSL